MATALGGIASKNVIMVFAYAAIGLLSSIIGVATARIGRTATPIKHLAAHLCNNSSFRCSHSSYDYLWFSMAHLGCNSSGLIVAVIGIATDYFTNDNRRLFRRLPKPQIGTAFTILSGFHMVY